MISVCMATYNGSQFVSEQVQSIISQINASDELIIVDDCSSDNTLEEVRKIGDSRIHIVESSHNQGPIASFAVALNLAQGDFIFLADQDDVWHENKVSRVMSAFYDQDADLVVHDGVVTDTRLNPIDNSWNHYNHSKPTHSLFKTLVKNSYTGAMMAMRRDLLNMVLPFPQSISMHDWWIALVALKKRRKIVILKEKLIDYRRHIGTVTGKRKPLKKMFLDRITMLCLVAKS